MKRFVLNLFLISTFVVGALWVKDLYDFSRVIRYPEVPLANGTDTSVDLIVVLTGGQGRFRAGLDLLKKFPKSLLFISGAETYVTLDDVLKANHEIDLDDSFRSRIWLGKFSKNTVENSIEVREIAEQINARSILLVTSSYHARRAMELIRRELDKSSSNGIRVYYHPVESPNFPTTGWWRRLIGWKIFFSEYFKSIQLWPSRVEE